MNKGKHIIKRQVFDFDTESRDSAAADQNDISRIFRYKLTTIIEEILDEFTPTGETILIDQITLDFGFINREFLEHDLVRKTKEQLPAILAELIKTKKKTSTKATVPAEASHENLLEIYLKTGKFPWWADEEENNPQQLIENLLKNKPQELINLLKRLLPQENVFKRLYLQFSLKTLQEINQKAIHLDNMDKLNPIVHLLNLLSNQHSKKIFPAFPIEKMLTLLALEISWSKNLDIKSASISVLLNRFYQNLGEKISQSPKAIQEKFQLAHLPKSNTPLDSGLKKVHDFLLNEAIESNETKQENGDFLQSFKSFLEKGFFPAKGAFHSIEDIEFELIQLIENAQSDSLNSIRSILTQPLRFKRFTQQFSLDAIRLVNNFLANEESEMLSHLRNNWLPHLLEVSPKNFTRGFLKKNIEAAFLKIITNNRALVGKEEQFWLAILEDIAINLNLSLEILLEKLETKLAGYPDATISQSLLSRLSQINQKEDFSDLSSDNFQPADIRASLDLVTKFLKSDSLSELNSYLPAEELEVQLSLLIQERGALARNLLQEHLIRNTTFKRVAQQLSADALEEINLLFGANQSGTILSYIRDFQRLRQLYPFEFSGDTDFDKILQESILEHLLHQAGSVFRPIRFLQKLLENIALKYNTSAEKLLKQFEKASRSLGGKEVLESSLWNDLEQLGNIEELEAPLDFEKNNLKSSPQGKQKINSFLQKIFKEHFPPSKKSPKNIAEFEKIILQIKPQESPLLKKVLEKLLLQKELLEEVIFNYSAESIQKISQTFNPIRYRSIRTQITHFQSLPLGNIFPEHTSIFFQKTLEVSALKFLLSQNGQIFQATNFLEFLLKDLSTIYKIAYHKIAKNLKTEWEKNPQKRPKENTFQKEMLRIIDQWNDIEIKKSVTQKPKNFAPTEEQNKTSNSLKPIDVIRFYLEKGYLSTRQTGIQTFAELVENFKVLIQKKDPSLRQVLRRALAMKNARNRFFEQFSETIFELVIPFLAEENFKTIAQSIDTILQVYQKAPSKEVSENDLKIALNKSAILYLISKNEKAFQVDIFIGDILENAPQFLKSTAINFDNLLVEVSRKVEPEAENKLALSKEEILIHYLREGYFIENQSIENLAQLENALQKWHPSQPSNFVEQFRQHLKIPSVFERLFQQFSSPSIDFVIHQISENHYNAVSKYLIDFQNIQIKYSLFSFSNIDFKKNLQKTTLLYLLEKEIAEFESLDFVKKVLFQLSFKVGQSFEKVIFIFKKAVFFPEISLNFQNLPSSKKTDGHNFDSSIPKLILALSNHYKTEINQEEVIFKAALILDFIKNKKRSANDFFPTKESVEFFIQEIPQLINPSSLELFREALTNLISDASIKAFINQEFSRKTLKSIAKILQTENKLEEEKTNLEGSLSPIDSILFYLKKGYFHSASPSHNSVSKIAEVLKKLSHQKDPELRKGLQKILAKETIKARLFQQFPSDIFEPLVQLLTQNRFPKIPDYLEDFQIVYQNEQLLGISEKDLKIALNKAAIIYIVSNQETSFQPYQFLDKIFVEASQFLAFSKNRFIDFFQQKTAEQYYSIAFKSLFPDLINKIETPAKRVANKQKFSEQEVFLFYLSRGFFIENQAIKNLRKLEIALQKWEPQSPPTFKKRLKRTLKNTTAKTRFIHQFSTEAITFINTILADKLWPLISSYLRDFQNLKKEIPAFSSSKPAFEKVLQQATFHFLTEKELTQFSPSNFVEKIFIYLSPIYHQSYSSLLSIFEKAVETQHAKFQLKSTLSGIITSLSENEKLFATAEKEKSDFLERPSQSEKINVVIDYIKKGYLPENEIFKTPEAIEIYIQEISESRNGNSYRSLKKALQKLLIQKEVLTFLLETLSPKSIKAINKILLEASISTFEVLPEKFKNALEQLLETQFSLSDFEMQFQQILLQASAFELPKIIKNTRFQQVIIELSADSFQVSKPKLTALIFPENLDISAKNEQEKIQETQTQLPDKKVEEHAEEAQKWALLTYFLKKGSVPEWYPKASPALVESIFEQFLSKAPNKIENVLAHLRQQVNLVYRITTHFSLKLIEKLLSFYAKPLGIQLIPILAGFDQTLQESPFRNKSISLKIKDIREHALQIMFYKSIKQPANLAFLKMMVINIANDQNASYGEVLETITNVQEKRKAPSIFQQIIQRLSNEIIAADAEGFLLALSNLEKKDSSIAKEQISNQAHWDYLQYYFENGQDPWWKTEFQSVDKSFQHLSENESGFLKPKIKKFFQSTTTRKHFWTALSEKQILIFSNKLAGANQSLVKLYTTFISEIYIEKAFAKKGTNEWLILKWEPVLEYLAASSSFEAIDFLQTVFDKLMKKTSVEEAVFMKLVEGQLKLSLEEGDLLYRKIHALIPAIKQKQATLLGLEAPKDLEEKTTIFDKKEKVEQGQSNIENASKSVSSNEENYENRRAQLLDRFQKQKEVVTTLEALQHYLFYGSLRHFHPDFKKEEVEDALKRLIEFQPDLLKRFFKRVLSKKVATQRVTSQFSKPLLHNISLLLYGSIFNEIKNYWIDFHFLLKDVVRKYDHPKMELLFQQHSLSYYAAVSGSFTRISFLEFLINKIARAERQSFLSVYEKIKNQLVSEEREWASPIKDYLEEMDLRFNLLREKEATQTPKMKKDTFDLGNNTPDKDETHFIHNAGLVLVAYLLQHYFKLLEMLDETEKAFKDEAAAIRAVHLTQFLVSGHSETSEHLLVFNKIMTGLAVEIPVPAGIEMSEHEIETSEELLNVVLQNWNIGSPDFDSLRGGFLIRNGRLNAKSDRWELRVEKKAYDVLMDRFPWTISIIHLPWLDKPIHVTWN